MNIPPPPPPPRVNYERKMRDRLAEIIMVELIRKCMHLEVVPKTSYEIADLMIQERRKF